MGIRPSYIKGYICHAYKSTSHLYDECICYCYIYTSILRLFPYKVIGLLVLSIIHNIITCLLSHCYNGSILCFVLSINTNPERLSVVSQLYISGVNSTIHIQEGIGHGCITQLVFSPENPTYIYTSSINGTVCMKDFEYQQSEVFIDTMDLRQV